MKFRHNLISGHRRCGIARNGVDAFGETLPLNVDGQLRAAPETGLIGLDDDALFQASDDRVGNIIVSVRTEIAEDESGRDGVGQTELRLDRRSRRAIAAILHGFRIGPQQDALNIPQRKRRMLAQAQRGCDAVVRMTHTREGFQVTLEDGPLTQWRRGCGARGTVAPPAQHQGGVQGRHLLAGKSGLSPGPAAFPAAAAL